LLILIVLLKDDKASLAEFHHALRGDIATAGPHERFVTSGSEEGDSPTTPTCSGHRSSISSHSPRSERRGSLQATSMISLDSECSTAIPSPQTSSFQQRRKRAAKLMQFFGVDYRELFDDVLESIESDMQLGQRDHMLRAEEVEVSSIHDIEFVGGLTADSGSPSEATQTEV
jgi:hypothetical protein